MTHMLRSVLLMGALAVSTGCPKPALPPTPPVVTADNTWAPDAPVVAQTVANGELWHLHRPGLPLVSLRLVLPGGSSLDPAEQHGLTSFSDDMLLRGSGDMDAAAFSAALQRDAIDLSVQTHRSATVVSLDCTADVLPAALALLDQALTAPSFDAAEVDRARAQRIQSRKDALDDPRSVASAVGWSWWFGADSPYAHSGAGTVSGLEAIAPDDLSASWTARARPETARWVVVGDADLDTVQDLLEKQFGDWAPSGDAPPTLPPPPGRTVPHAKGGRILVDNPGASQTVLRVWMPGWSPTDPRLVAGDLGTVVLGGTFTSRLNALLREEKGYTYGARASVVTGQGYGAVQVYTNVFIDTTGDALADLTGELKRITEGVTEDEVGKARASRRTDAIEVAAGRASTAYHLVGLAVDGRPADAQLSDLRLADRVQKSDIDGVMATLSLDDAMVVVVGDLEKIRAPVEAALPGDWQVVDVHGKPVQ